MRATTTAPIPADVLRTPEGWRLDLALPGARVEDVDVRLERDRLRVLCGGRERRFLVPENVEVDAALQHGVLRLALRRTAPERRTIEVRAS